MPAATPRRLVHWALEPSLSDLASPFVEGSSTDSYSSTSSLQYVNSQLIAHGFVHDAGLSLEGLPKGDVDRVVKCILSMLGQRIVSTISSSKPENVLQQGSRTTWAEQRICRPNCARLHTTMNVSLQCTRHNPTRQQMQSER